jgi:hypothetical protein
MLPRREELLAKAAALPEPPISFGACWDGDSEGWFVIFYAMLGEQRCHHLAYLRGDGDFRLFVGSTPPWPEAELAQAVGAELAARFSVPFVFPSPDSPAAGYVPAHTMTMDEKADAVRAQETFLERVEQLKEYGHVHRPSEVLALLIKLIPGLEPSDIIFHFKKAFPQVPLSACIEAQRPAQLCKGGLTDKQFDALIAPWPAVDTIHKS